MLAIIITISFPALSMGKMGPAIPHPTSALAHLGQRPREEVTAPFYSWTEEGLVGLRAAAAPSMRQRQACSLRPQGPTLLQDTEFSTLCMYTHSSRENPNACILRPWIAGVLGACKLPRLLPASSPRPSWSLPHNLN